MNFCRVSRALRRRARQQQSRHDILFDGFLGGSRFGCCQRPRGLFISLIVMDLSMMPGVDGATDCAQIDSLY